MRLIYLSQGGYLSRMERSWVGGLGLLIGALGVISIVYLNLGGLVSQYIYYRPQSTGFDCRLEVFSPIEFSHDDVLILDDDFKISFQVYYGYGKYYGSLANGKEIPYRSADGRPRWTKGWWWENRARQLRWYFSPPPADIEWAPSAYEKAESLLAESNPANSDDTTLHVETPAFEKMDLADEEPLSCDQTYTISAPSFTVAPSTSLTISASNDGTPVDVTWVLKPESMGEKKIISIDDGEFTIGEYSVAVKNTFGLSVKKVKIVSWAFVGLGALIAVPWLGRVLEKIRPRRRRRLGQ